MDAFITYNLSDFLQQSGKILPELEAGRDVLLRRRAKPSLILTAARREQVLRDSLRTAAALILAILGDEPEVRPNLVERAVDRIPWLATLPQEERVQFLREFARTARGALETGILEPLWELQDEWEITSRIYADPTLAKALDEPVPETHSP